MVQAWYMDDDPADQRLEHHRNPPEYISLTDLYKKTGVEYFELNMATYETDGRLARLRAERGYTYEDEITCSEHCLPDYAEKLKSFYQEHLHTDEEIRLCVEGSGYFDVRDAADRWVRVRVTPGDMIVIPSGIYHRFTLDDKNFIRARRFFIGDPVWAPHNRPADHLPARADHLRRLAQLAQ